MPPAEGVGLEIGDHAFGRSGDPAGSRAASAAEIGPLVERCRSLLKGFEYGRIDRLKACFYTVTDGERFVVETRDARGWVMSPCSGHGSERRAEMGWNSPARSSPAAVRPPSPAGRPVWKAISLPDRMC